MINAAYSGLSGKFKLWVRSSFDPAEIRSYSRQLYSDRRREPEVPALRLVPINASNRPKPT
jgi:hypothetical protein